LGAVRWSMYNGNLPRYNTAIYRGAADRSARIRDSGLRRAAYWKTHQRPEGDAWRIGVEPRT